MPINFPNSPNNNDIYSSGNTTWQWNGTVWNVISSGSPVNIPNVFNTVAVAGQSNVVADSASDTLTLVAGTNISITTNASADSITINSTGGAGGGSNAFGTISVAGQPTITADAVSDTLTIVAGSGITLTSTSETDTLTIAATSSSSSFSLLTDVAAANLTIDQVYLQAITRLVVTNTGAVAYLFDQYTGNNPTIYALNGTTIAFELRCGGHPFLVQTSVGNNFNTGLVHVASNGTVSLGANAQAKDSGTLYWKVPDGASGGFRYQCSLHAPMVGSIFVKNFSAI